MFPHNYVLRKPRKMISCYSHTTTVSTQLCPTETTVQEFTISYKDMSFHTIMSYGNEDMDVESIKDLMFPHNYVLRKQPNVPIGTLEDFVFPHNYVLRKPAFELKFISWRVAFPHNYVLRKHTHALRYAFISYRFHTIMSYGNPRGIFLFLKKGEYHNSYLSFIPGTRSNALHL